MLRLIIFSLFIISVNGISPFLNHYEPLNYSITHLARASRSAQPHDSLRIDFNVFNRTFKLHLRKISPEESVFVEDAIVEFGNVTMKVNRGEGMYSGTVEGDSHSYVYGSMDDGVFSGVIETGDGKEYGIECTSRYNTSVPFHSFIYDVTHINMPNRTKVKRPISPSESDSDSMCGLSDPKIAENTKIEKDKTSNSSFRSKREAELFKENKMCTLFIHVDHTLYNYHLKTTGNDAKKANAKIMRLVEKEIKGVNQVYESTDFGGIKGITFKPKRTKIWESKDEKDYPFKDESVDVNGFLAENSRQKYDDVCLGYVMTYRDFSGGTLGLAFVGGLCAVHRPGKETQASTNAGIVTYLNFGNPVLERVSYLTLAHEIGHNFGSNHDQTEECKGGNDGQYIMWYSATSGDQPNNKRFSECSIKQMTDKLKEIMKIDPKAKDQRHTRNCFLPSDAAMCGNGATEKGEECDCGDETGCQTRGDTCCYPAGTPNLGTKKRECTLKEGNKCAPSQGECCNAKCEFKSVAETCAEETKCSKASKCLGNNFTCPVPLPNTDNENEPCNDATGLCNNGQCNTSMLCTNVEGFMDCTVRERSCYRHCMKKDGGVCKSTALIDEFNNEKFLQKGRWGQSGVMLSPMSQCYDGQGTCDQFDVCNRVRATGLMRKKFEEFSSFFQGLTRKWWVIALIVIVVVALLVVVIKFCSYATPSSNPNKPKAKSIKEIKNMMSDRVKNMSKRAQKKIKKVKGGGSTTPVASAQTPGGSAQTPGGQAAPTPADKSKKTNEDDE